MLNPLAFVGVVAQPPEDRTLPRTPIRFGLPDRTVYLQATHPSFDFYKRTLARVSALGRPVFVETAPGSVPGEPDLVRILLPKISRVIDFTFLGASGQVHVQLETSSARHFVGAPLAADHTTMALLRASMVDRVTLFISDHPETHEILDVREAFASFQRQAPAVDGPVLGEPAVRDVSIVDDATLKSAFGAGVQGRCDVSALESGCTPFQYPDDYCWARAQRVVESLNPSLVAGKVWVYGSLSARTPFVPGCNARWDWHCAVFLRRSRFDLYVMDPTLFTDGAVPYVTWLDAIAGVQIVEFSEARVYKMPVARDARAETEPKESDNALEDCRLLLDQRFSTHGLPPYKCS